MFMLDGVVYVKSMWNGVELQTPVSLSDTVEDLRQLAEKLDTDAGVSDTDYVAATIDD